MYTRIAALLPRRMARHPSRKFHRFLTPGFESGINLTALDPTNLPFSIKSFEEELGLGAQYKSMNAVLFVTTLDATV